MTDPKTPKSPKPPAHQVTFGRVRARAWLIDDNRQRPPWYSVTLERLYQEVQGTQVLNRVAHSFGRDDLLAGAEALRQMWLWVMANPPDNRLSEGRDGEAKDRDD